MLKWNEMAPWILLKGEADLMQVNIFNEMAEGSDSTTPQLLKDDIIVIFFLSPTNCLLFLYLTDQGTKGPSPLTAFYL